MFYSEARKLLSNYKTDLLLIGKGSSSCLEVRCVHGSFAWPTLLGKRVELPLLRGLADAISLEATAVKPREALTAKRKNPIANCLRDILPVVADGGLR
jgi:hypothetical protein